MVASNSYVVRTAFGIVGFSRLVSYEGCYQDIKILDRRRMVQNQWVNFKDTSLEVGHSE